MAGKAPGDGRRRLRLPGGVEHQHDGQAKRAREISPCPAPAPAEAVLPEGAGLRARIERGNRGYLRAYELLAPMLAVLEQVATFNPRLAEIRRGSRRAWVKRGAESFRRWQGRGLIAADVDVEYAANALGAMVDRCAYVWIVLKEPYEFDRAVQQLTLLYCNALGLPRD